MLGQKYGELSCFNFRLRFVCLPSIKIRSYKNETCANVSFFISAAIIGLRELRNDVGLRCSYTTVR